MAMKWNLIVDIERCNNCRVCFLAVKDEHIGNDFPGYAAAQPAQGHNWMEIERKERGSYPIVEANFMPVMCNHCDDPPCMKAAQGGAVSKRSKMPVRMVRFPGTRNSRFRRHGFSTHTCWMMAGRKPARSNVVRRMYSYPSRLMFRKCSSLTSRKAWKSCSRKSGPGPACIIRICI